jgi:carboxyl-terminal processing protease
MIVLFRYIFFNSTFIILTVCASGQATDRFCEQNKSLLHILENKHYKPIAIGGELSSRTYKLFLQALDPHGLYFVAPDTNILSLCKKNILEDPENADCKITFQKICTLYHQRLKEADTLISLILQKPFDFALTDSIYFGDNEKLTLARDQQMLKRGWIKWLTYEALLYLFSPDSANDKPFAKNNQVILRKEPEVRNKLKVREKRYIRRILNNPDGFENYVASAFLNAVAGSFDPHSSYFSPSDKRNFESAISPEALSYGFELGDNSNGTVQISRLVPGGPAWKSNELHKGDVLVQVRWPNGETVDFSCSDSDEANEIIQSSSSDQMELTIKKTNGQLKSVMLIKKMLKTDENLIKSFVLKGKKNVGYISLPGFYTEWENQDPAGCSNDIAKEIVKLKQENIEGVIIDLRNNGGGAMSEAIALAGTFIEGGPLSILSERDRKLTLLRDASLGTVYDGPLVLMVNGFSASASEILAASLQDYHRAVIVGSPTFGKATGQIIIPLDSSAKSKDEGFVKITNSRFYRLNGSSYQQKGVIPDVILPAYFEGFSFQEANQPYAFGADSVMKKVNYTPLPDLPVKELKKKSIDRTAANERFKKISTTADSLQQVIKQLKAVSINIDLFRKKEAWIFDAIQLLGKEEEQPSALLHVSNVKYDQYLNNLSTYRKEINDLIIKNLQSDIYLEESYQIINDLINSN